jgi:hypothetical protein
MSTLVYWESAVFYFLVLIVGRGKGKSLFYWETVKDHMDANGCCSFLLIERGCTTPEESLTVSLEKMNNNYMG